VLETEAFSLAARLYVVMRQKLGRITDVQWMLKNPEYAVEIIRLAREQGGSELPVLADKFEAIAWPQLGQAQVRTGERRGRAALCRALALVRNSLPEPAADIEVPCVGKACTSAVLLLLESKEALK
jgi:hypothetical protein